MTLNSAYSIKQEQGGFTILPNGEDFESLKAFQPIAIKHIRDGVSGYESNPIMESDIGLPGWYSEVFFERIAE